MFTTKYSKKQPKKAKHVYKFAAGGSTTDIKPPLQIKNTWMDLEQNSGPGSLTKEEAKRSDTPVKRSGYPR
jgi:hypothetical protein